MTPPIPFTFGIPLISRWSAGNWIVIETLIELTLSSVLSQTDQDFRVVIAGHDRPAAIPDDPRIAFLQADWPAERPRSDNADSGRKKHVINEFVLASGGGYLMFLDADDWVDTRLVATARAVLGTAHLGGLITTGLAIDIRSLRSAAIPHPQIFDRAFHRICGSSMIARLDPAHADPLRRNPYAVLHEHYLAIETAQRHGADLIELPLVGSYLVNTSENHSETHGPFAEWRRTFSEEIVREGRPLDQQSASRFGLDLAMVAAASCRLNGAGSEAAP